MLNTVILKLFAGALTLLSAFLFGFFSGRGQVQKAWDLDKRAQAQAVEVAAFKTEIKEQAAVQITKEVQNDVSTDKDRVAARGNVVFDRLRTKSQVCPSTVPEVPRATPGADAARTDPIPARPADVLDCKQIAIDAAQAAVVINGWREWYEKQSSIYNAQTP